MRNSTKSLLLATVMVAISLLCHGQQDTYDTLYLSRSKTVILVFEDIVRHVDAGSADILFETVQGEGGNSNKLKLAASKWFKESSLFIETKSAMFTYIVRYRENPPKLLLRVSDASSQYKHETLHEEGKSVEVAAPEKGRPASKASAQAEALSEIRNNALKVSAQEGTLHSYGAKDAKVFFYLPEMYISGDNFYFLVRIKNVSNIPYDIDFTKLVVRTDKATMKKNAVQEEEKKPEYVLNGEVKTIAGKSEETRVYVVKKFTIDTGKRLVFELWERGGERKLEFSIFPSDILNIKKL